MKSSQNISFHPTILREYDIRGVFGETLFEKDAYWIGRCLGHIVRKKAGKSIAIGRDGRLSSSCLESALIQGLYEAGLKIYRLGLGPTPLLYFAEYELPIDAAIMVTGSHNPPSHNGFKISVQRQPFFGRALQTLSQLNPEELTTGRGEICEMNLKDAYIKCLLHGFEFKRNLSVAWDLGNGATALIIKEIIKLLPGKHILLNSEINGDFPSHPPDPSDPDNLVQLQQCVIENGCDIGIAFDGDGDRLAAVDERGCILFGDQLLLLFARDLLTRKPNATIVADIKTSQVFLDEVTRLGGQALLWKTGHSHIKEKMATSGATLGGEMSGHFFFKENYYGFDDGIYAALQLLYFLSESSQKLGTLYDALPTLVSTPEIRIPCTSQLKFKIPQKIKSRLLDQNYSIIDIDGVRVRFNDGWWLLRASHTQDILVVRCESSTKEGLECVKEHLKKELAIENVFIE